jgi:hypothetical protein
LKPDEQSQWPSGLIVQETLTAIKKGKSTILEIPVFNNTQHDIMLPKRTVLGRIQLVRSVTEVDVRLKGSEENEDRDVMGQSEASTTGGKEHDANQEESVTPKVDLTGLTPEQRPIARKKLYEERDAFAKNEDDIGRIPDLQMNINLTYMRPVQMIYIYTAIPRPLYPEVNQCLEDQLNKNFIRKSKSPYSSSVVCVRTKDGGMRLCADYRELNKKTVPDPPPNPKNPGDIGQYWRQCMVQHVRPRQSLLSGLCKPRMPTINSLYNSVGFVRVGKDTIRFDERTRQLSTLYGGLFGRSTRPSMYPRFRRCNCVRNLQRLQSHGVKLQPGKCKLFHREVSFLGRVISKSGYYIDPKATEAVKKLKDSIPKRVGDVR